MKKILLFFILAMSLQAAASKLVTYSAPENMESAPEFKLEVDGRNVFVYNTRSAAFACFSFEGTFTIHNGDRAVITNVLYEDIRVEDSRGWLIDFRILESRYSQDSQRGKIENVRFKDIVVEGEHYPSSQILGFNDTYTIKNITLENFFIHGNRINSVYNGMISTVHLENLEFK